METSLSVVKGFEDRIDGYKREVGHGLIGIGMVLIEAKQSGAIPHGEWISWVERTTDMSIRQAQRCMYLATRVKVGSKVEQLDMSKGVALLGSGLGEEQVEQLAGEAIEKKYTTRELNDAIAAAKAEAMKDVDAKVAMAATNARSAAFEEANQKLNEALAAKDEEISRISRITVDIDPDEVKKLRKYNETLSNQLALANDAMEKMQDQMNAGAVAGAQSAAEFEDHEAVELTPDAVQLAVNTLMGVCGVLPYIHPSGQEWNSCIASLRQLRDWADKSLQAINVLEVM